MTTESELPEQVAKIFYEQAADNLKQQRASLDEMRSRTAALLSASAISNAFLGAVASKGTGVFHLPPRFWIALAPFGLSLLLCIGVLWYSSGWEFSFRSDNLAEAIPSHMSLNEIYFKLTHDLESMNKNNEERIRFRSLVFSAAAFATLFAVVAWLFLIE